MVQFLNMGSSTRAREVRSAISQRRERDRQLREQDFLDAAEALFGEKGYNGTGMEEIAAKAGYGTGTLYLYFRSKKALYQSLLDRKTEEYFRLLQEAASGVGTPAVRLEAVLAAQFDYFRAHRNFIRIYVSEFLRPESMLSAGMSAKARLLERKHQLLLERLIKEGVASGEFREVDPAYSVAAIKGLGEQMLLVALGPSRRGDPEEPFHSAESFMIQFIQHALRH